MNSIELQKVSKKYTLTHERPMLLKTLFARSQKEEIWALKDINLEIKKGETVGIIGENGSGKSTLLKILTGITTPTQGKVIINGRVASLLELGAGFHPNLTGKENIYLNGSILGLTKKEIDQKFQQIIEFAGIGNFIDVPVSKYSSGMFVRLGFAVAVHLDPDILLLDEVLAVGDLSFQNKCYTKIQEFQNSGRTIILVSHILPAIEALCSKVVLLHDGQIIKVGCPKEVILEYTRLQILQEEARFKQKNEEQSKIDKIKKDIPANRIGDGAVRIFQAWTADDRGEKRALFKRKNLEIVVMFDMQFFQALTHVFFGIVVKDALFRDIFKTNTPLFQTSHISREGILRGEFRIKNIFPHGQYFISIGIASNSLGQVQHDLWINACVFSMSSSTDNQSVESEDYEFQAYKP